MKYWYVSRQVLTQGIKEIDGSLSSDHAIASILGPKIEVLLLGGGSTLYPVECCFESEVVARAKAMTMQQSRIASLERQLAKMRALDFTKRHSEEVK